MITKFFLLLSIFSLNISSKLDKPGFVSKKEVEEDSTNLQEEHSPTPLDLFNQIATDIQNNFVYIFPDYSSLEDPSPTDAEIRPEQKIFKKCFSYYNRNANEHMFSLCLEMNMETQNLILNVQNAGKLSFAKEFKPWDRRELVYQMPIFQDAIWHSLRYIPFWRTHSMHVNLFNDLKNDLKKKIPGLSFEVGANPVDTLETPFFAYKMKHDNVYLGNVRLAISGSQDQKDLADLSLNRNQLITIGFDISKDNMIQSGDLNLSAIAIGTKAYNDFVGTVVSALDFQNQFNNLDQMFKMVKKYLEKNYPKISIKEQPTQTSDPLFENRYYSIEHEFSKLEMYIGTSQSAETGTEFTLMIDQKGGQFHSPLVQTKLKRSSQKVLDGILDMLGVGRMMKSIRDTIMDMFKTAYESYRILTVQELNKKDHGDLVHFAENPIMGKNYVGIKNKEFRCGLVEEAGKRVKGHFVLSATSTEYQYKYFFYMDSFNQKLMERTIRNFFDSQVY